MGRKNDKPVAAKVRDLSVNEGSDVKGGGLLNSVSQALDNIAKATETAARKA